MTDIRPADLIRVAQRLESLDLPFVFVGGGVLPFLIDDPAAPAPRGTGDVDVVIEVVAHKNYTALEDKLRALGFRDDIREGAPICRWIMDDLVVDVMPIQDERMGMNTRWFKEALDTANEQCIETCRLHVVSPACFLALKLSAFEDRGKGDFLGSRDIEDIVSIVDGRLDLLQDIQTGLTSIRTFVQERIRELLGTSAFMESLPGHLGSEQDRLDVLLERFNTIAQR